MIDFILALINTVISFNAEYNATHLLPFATAAFMGLMCVVVLPLLMYMMRETPVRTIARIAPIIHVYDTAIERVRTSTTGTQATR